MLLLFLEQLFKLREFPGMQDSTLLRIIIPYCRRPLLERLLDCVKRGGRFDSFHQCVLNFFLPGHLQERLQLERFYRPQRLGEGLAAYVCDIRGA
ncbi:hypothetical protein, partial [Klebsiella pneumoniae]|uniref:hypothetical protein n=1 Tax=Klebsiella pneumoniae TaxID=573 RepID=UPI001C8FA586